MFAKDESSGLVLPVEPPKQREKPFGPLEIEDEDDREATKLALQHLWKATGLIHGSSIGVVTPRSTKMDGIRRLYHYVAQELLGDEVPETWEYT